MDIGEYQIILCLFVKLFILTSFIRLKFGVLRATEKYISPFLNLRSHFSLIGAFVWPQRRNLELYHITISLLVHYLRIKHFRIKKYIKDERALSSTNIVFHINITAIYNVG